MSDRESAELDAITLLGGWRMLCVHVLREAVAVLEVGSKLTGSLDRTSQEHKFFFNRARNWLDGGTGVVTFEECCEVMGVQPVVAREKINNYVHSRRRKPVHESFL